MLGFTRLPLKSWPALWKLLGSGCVVKGEAAGPGYSWAVSKVG